MLINYSNYKLQPQDLNQLIRLCDSKDLKQKYSDLIINYPPEDIAQLIACNILLKKDDGTIVANKPDFIKYIVPLKQQYNNVIIFYHLKTCILKLKSSWDKYQKFLNSIASKKSLIQQQIISTPEEHREALYYVEAIFNNIYQVDEYLLKRIKFNQKKQKNINNLLSPEYSEYQDKYNTLLFATIEYFEIKDFYRAFRNIICHAEGLRFDFCVVQNLNKGLNQAYLLCDYNMLENIKDTSISEHMKENLWLYYHDNTIAMLRYLNEFGIKNIDNIDPNLLIRIENELDCL